MYNILQAHIEYKDRKLYRVTVLVEISERDLRVIFSTPTIGPGYDAIRPDEPVTDELLQRIAGYGRQTHDLDKLFPGWKAQFKKRHNERKP